MKITVAATGDSLFCADFPVEYKEKRRELDAFLGGCDLKLTNLETNLSDYGSFANQYSGGTWLNARKELFPNLASFGFNFYGTANNHCMDYSYKGLLSTVDFLDGLGIAHAGTGRSLAEAEAPALIGLPDGRRAAVFAVDASMEAPSMAGDGSRVFSPRPGVNFLRHESVFRVSDGDLADLKRIAKNCGVNSYRDGEIASGYMPPDRDGIFVFGGTAFSAGDAENSRCEEDDLERICGLIRKAKNENGLVFLLVHCHDEEGPTPEEPPAYLREFCRAAVESGADGVFGAGFHRLRGIEIFCGRPIFYSLGNFIYQGMRVEFLPPDFMEKYAVDPDAPASEGLAARSQGGRIGLQTNRNNFLTAVPKITFDGDEITEISLLPVCLGFDTGNEKLDGLPVFARGADGERICEILDSLSRPFGTKLTFDRETGMITCGLSDNE